MFKKGERRPSSEVLGDRSLSIIHFVRAVCEQKYPLAGKRQFHSIMNQACLRRDLLVFNFIHVIMARSTQNIVKKIQARMLVNFSTLFFFVLVDVITDLVLL